MSSENGGNGPEPEERPTNSQWPRCAYCGSLALHASSRGGLYEDFLRLTGVVIYRCEECRRRFAFRALGRGHRRHRRHSQQHQEQHQEQRAALVPELESPRPEERRRTWIRRFATAIAALVTFLVALYLMHRSEQRRLEGAQAEIPISQ
jgi:DNA-directed RNA polymerase subunit RPC12/RpoP